MCEKKRYKKITAMLVIIFLLMEIVFYWYKLPTYSVCISIGILFPSTVHGITHKRFSWNGFIYEEEDAKDGHVIIVDYTKSERNVTIPSEIRGKKVEAVSSLGDSQKIKTVSLPDGIEIVAKALSQCSNLKTVHVKKSININFREFPITRPV